MSDKQKFQVKLGSALSTLALVIAVVLCLTVIIQVTTTGYVSIGGYSLFRVVTGSMEPALPVGTLIVCKDIPIETIELGDIICFRSLNPKMLGKVITHRVTTIHQEKNGTLLLETKGDANLVADSEFVTQSNLIGRVNHSDKDDNIMTSVVDIMTDKIGFLVLVLFPTLLIAGFILRSCMMNMRRDIELALEEEKRIKKEKAILITEQEYNSMLERIRQELLEEMRHDVSENVEQNTGTGSQPSMELDSEPPAATNSADEISKTE